MKPSVPKRVCAYCEADVNLSHQTGWIRVLDMQPTTSGWLQLVVCEACETRPQPFTPNERS